MLEEEDNGFRHYWKGCLCGNQHFYEEDRGGGYKPPSSVVDYTYTDANGKPVYRMSKIPNPKQFLGYSHPEGNGWANCKTCGHDKVPYNLPALVAETNADRPRIIVEGEKDAETLIARGHLATTNPFGAGKFNLIKDKSPFKGVTVIYVGDNDEDGRKHEANIKKALGGVASRLIPFGPISDGDNDGKDITDFINDGNSFEDRLTELLKNPLDNALNTFSLADVQPMKQSWLWPGYLPEGDLTLLVGDTGLGKSFVTLDLASRITTGALWPDGLSHAPLGNVIIASMEDRYDRIAYRTQELGADRSRITCIPMLIPDGQDQDLLSLERHLPALEHEIIKRKAKLLVLDHILAFMGEKTDTDGFKGVTRILAKLSAISQRTGCAVLAIMHLNKKSSEANMGYRIMGSTAFRSVARSILAVGVDTDSDNPEVDRILGLNKTNLTGPMTSLKFYINSVPTLVWNGTSDIAMDNLLITSDKPNKTQVALDFLEEILGDAPRKTTEVDAEAMKRGINKYTLRLAKETRRIVNQRISMVGEPRGTGAFYLWLPEHTVTDTVQHDTNTDSYYQVETDTVQDANNTQSYYQVEQKNMVNQAVDEKGERTLYGEI